MSPRTRIVLGPADHECRLCGEGTPELVKSSKVRRLRDRLNVAWDPEVRFTEVCPACRARSRVDAPITITRA